MRTFAEAGANSVVTRKVDDKYPLRFCRRRTTTPRVPKIDDEAKSLEGCALKKAVRPDLDPGHV